MAHIVSKSKWEELAVDRAHHVHRKGRRRVLDESAKDQRNLAYSEELSCHMAEWRVSQEADDAQHGVDEHGA